MVTILIIIGISLWISVMLLAITINFKKLDLSRGIICNKDEKLIIFKVKLSYHRPGENWYRI